MHNKAMAKKLKKDECLDVRKIGTPVEGDPKVFELREFQEDVDYCDAQTESWIWSIGKRKSDGKIFASLDGRFYLNPQFECLWLR
jgi:hypothetical protein